MPSSSGVCKTKRKHSCRKWPNAGWQAPPPARRLRRASVWTLGRLLLLLLTVWFPLFSRALPTTRTQTCGKTWACLRQTGQKIYFKTKSDCAYSNLSKRAPLPQELARCEFNQQERAAGGNAQKTLQPEFGDEIAGAAAARGKQALAHRSQGHRSSVGNAERAQEQFSEDGWSRNARGVLKNKTPS